MNFDAIVLGGGSAGYAAARTFAGNGLKTAVVDGAAELGGLCILRGCMPTKALLYAAELRQAIENAREWGIEAGQPRIDLGRMFKKKDDLVSDFAAYRRGQLTSGRFELIRSTARFVSPGTAALADGREVSAPRWVIATGSQVAPLPVASLEGLSPLTSDAALQLDRLPKSLVVLGGGPVALEFAQFFHRLGVAVEIIQRSAHVLRDADADVAGELEKALRREGVVIHTGARLIGGRLGEGVKIVEFETDAGKRRAVAAEVFHGLGRRPATGGLGLEAAGVQTRATGEIQVDAGQLTTAPGVGAAGDCCGPHEIVHLAVQQGEVAAWNLMHPHRPKAMDYRLLLSVVFTDPQMAQVGLTERGAKAAGLEIKAATYPFNDHGKSIILGSREGLVKLIVNAATRELLGAACVGPQAGELIHEATVAVAARMTAAQFAAIPHYHPTLAEIWTYPAEELAE